MAKWPTDEELEEIYRKGSEKHSFDYDPKAWEDMNALLDEKENKKVLFFIFLGVLLLTLGGLYYGYNQINDNTKSIQLKESTEYAISMEKESPTEIKESNSFSQNNKEVNSSNSELKATIIDNDSNDNNIISGTITIPETTPPFKTVSAISILNEEPRNQSRITIESSNSNEEKVQLNKNKSSILSTADLLNAIEPITVAIIHTKGTTSFPTAQYILFPELGPASPRNIDQEKTSSGFIVTALLGAESSWTTNGEFSRIDYAVGLGFSKRINNKLGFSIGSSYIRDLYIANQGDYKATSSFWRQSEEPNYTSADCKMLEINTGLTYYFNGWNSEGVAIHLGLLSNFMLSEKYDYHFEEESMNFSSSWATSNATWLNAINLSPVYNFSYGKKGQIEIGPYFKLPLSGIGHGDIMLSSFGFKGIFRIH